MACPTSLPREFCSTCRPRGYCLTNHRRSNVDIGSPISPSRYSRDPFVECADLGLRYGDRRRGRSASYSASSRSGHSFPRRHSSYGISPMMNPSTGFSDLLDAPWGVGRKRALCVRSSILTVPNAFKSLTALNSGQIGVSYFGDRRSELRGSADNARAVQHFLLRASHSASTPCSQQLLITTPCGCYIGHGYRNEDIRILAEDDYDPRRRPTKVNIIDAMHWLVKGAQPGDHLFFHCMCHS